MSASVVHPFELGSLPARPRRRMLLRWLPPAPPPLRLPAWICRRLCRFTLLGCPGLSSTKVCCTLTSSDPAAVVSVRFLFFFFFSFCFVEIGSFDWVFRFFSSLWFKQLRLWLSSTPPSTKTPHHCKGWSASKPYGSCSIYFVVLE